MLEELKDYLAAYALAYIIEKPLLYTKKNI